VNAHGSPSVAAAVLTWNGAHHIEMVLDSLEHQECDPFRTLVVDNGSTDGTVDLVGQRWPWAEIVALPENVGITAGMNRCVEAASGSEFVALLNSDVELDPRWLSVLVGALRAEPAAASASGKVLSFENRHLIDRAGDAMAWSGEAIGRGRGEVDRGQYDESGEVFAACGGIGLFRTAAFDAVGGFDEQFFAYHEDTDWGFRARLAGWTSIYTPAAVAWHVGGATAGQDSPFSLYHGMRNAIWLVVKNFPARSLVRHAPELVWRHVRLVFHAVAGGRSGLLLRAWRDALRGMPAVLRKRRAVQGRATARPEDLDRVMAGGWRPLS
jgi:GT2 family glycosyltransferase